MKRSQGPNSELIALDRAFHVIVATIVGNGVLIDLVGHLFDQRINPYFEQLARYFESPETWRQACAEHQKVRDAIVSRNARAAQAAMRSHLRNSQQRFSRSFAEPAARPGAATEPPVAIPSVSPAIRKTTRRKHA
jgi:DNA-binding GntR family transcriptional regulator